MRAYLAPAARRLAPNSAQAMVYQIARPTSKSGPPRPVVGYRLTRVTSEACRPVCRGVLAPVERKRDRHLTFVMFPVIDWHFRFQRPQQLARALGKRGHRVFYVSPDFLLSKDDEPFKVLESPARKCPFVPAGVLTTAPSFV